MKRLALSLLLAAGVAAFAADGTPAKPPRTTALGTCSKEAHAKGLKGDARKKFISACLAEARKARDKAATAPKSAG